MGKEVAALGVLMLDCPHFEVPGSLSSDETVPFPLRRREVRGATVERMMAGSDELRASIIEAARELERTGVKAIVGNCGFMALFQKVLQENVNVPVFASSLLFVPLVARIIPKGKRVGILTFHALHLKEAHFRETGWSSSEIPIAIAGIQHQRAWQHPFQVGHLESQLLEVCRGLIRDHEDLGALVLECTAMAPFAPRIRAETGLPVFDITTAATLAAESFSQDPF